jgi:hypothetical protein
MEIALDSETLSTALNGNALSSFCPALTYFSLERNNLVDVPRNIFNGLQAIISMYVSSRGKALSVDRYELINLLLLPQLADVE